MNRRVGKHVGKNVILMLLAVCLLFAGSWVAHPQGQVPPVQAASLNVEHVGGIGGTISDIREGLGVWWGEITLPLPHRYSSIDGFAW